MSPVPEDKLVEIKEALYRGRKIEAIKIYRQSTGVQLVDAKAAVDKLEEELRATRPENFMSTAERRGCLGLLMAGLVLALIALWITGR